MPVDVAAFSPPGSCRPIVMPGSTVVEPKIVRDVGTAVRISCDSRAPTLVFSTSTVGDAPLTVTVSCSDASFISASTVIGLPHGHDDPVADERRKAGEVELQRVGAGVDRREAVHAAFVR